MLLRPNWPAPSGVHAACSTRQGGVSLAPFDSNNLANGVGDSADAVAENRRRFAVELGASPLWLRLVHGTQVHRWVSAETSAPAPTADAAWTTERGLACTVSAADCLPVLFALRDGSAVAAAHAGWRGLAGGVIEATLAAVQQGTGAAASDFVVWLGPCIGPQHFEVGADVLAAFGHKPVGGALEPGPHFSFRPRADGAARWLADLAGLARQRLLAAGVQRISSSGLCTVSDPSSFFSYRRDGRTGRFVAAIFKS
jgi:polyphenol oxidase